jgi:hypothetical protein
MNLDDEEATGGLVDLFHEAAGRNSEDPPNRRARVHLGGVTAELWAGGTDGERWYYRVATTQGAPELVGHLPAGGDVGFQSDEPLLQQFVGKSLLKRDDWRTYLEEWLRSH